MNNTIRNSTRALGVRTLCAIFTSAVFFTADAATTYEHKTSVVISNLFKRNQIIEEVFPIWESKSLDFWVNSGGRFIISNGIGMTIQGALPTGDRWQKAYADGSHNPNNPVDTDNGKYPQNLFRLVTGSTWTNVSQEFSFYIEKVNMTATTNRDGYSGILVFGRYMGDGKTTYYAGVRQDGHVIIKKKYNGKYFPLAEKQVLSNGRLYDKVSNPNIIPEKVWIGLKTEVKNETDGNVSIKVFLDRGHKDWEMVLEGHDVPGVHDGTPVISGPAYVGIRTDYMDVLFKDYEIAELGFSAKPLPPTFR